MRSSTSIWPMAAAHVVITFLVLAPLSAAAQGTPAQRAACEGDAHRLCERYVPDEARIRSCLIQYRRYLSPACRAAMEAGRRGRR
jgi:hypothetical protein